jgi:hypothetical protein
VRTFTPSGFRFRQYSFTHRKRVIRSPCPTTLSDMYRLPGMLGLLWVSPPDMPVTQEPLLSSSCLRQGYHNAPHGAHRACHFHGTRLSVLAPLMDVQPHSDLAHEHGTTRRARSPALPENKALLLLALSDLGGLLPSVAHLSDLHPVQTITVWFLITTPPPPVTPARWHSRVPLAGQAVSEFPSSLWTCSRNP